MRVAILLVVAFGFKASGATLNSNGSASDTQSKINSAANGDTVLLPSSGSFTWSTTVDIPNTKYITLDGNSSTISLTGGISLEPHATGNSRITGFTLNISGGGDVTVNDLATTACWRLDHCTFTGTASAIVNFNGRGPGLMDHCTFPSIAAAQETIHVWGWGASDSTGWTTDASLAGSSNLLYIEDCTFRGAQGNSSCCFQCYYGARICARYNNVDGAMFECHGSSTMIGTRWWEYYGNKLTNMTVCLRAGSGLVFSNLCNMSFTMLEEDSGYPALYQIGRGINQTLDPAYYWQNVGDSGPVLNSTTMCASGSANMVQLNRDVYASARAGYTPYTYPHPLIGGGTPSSTNVAKSYGSASLGRGTY